MPTGVSMSRESLASAMSSPSESLRGSRGARQGVGCQGLMGFSHGDAAVQRSQIPLSDALARRAGTGPSVKWGVRRRKKKSRSLRTYA